MAAFGTGAAQGQGRPSEAKAAASTVTASSRAAIWAATAEYVYKDDRDLNKIQPDLLKTIKNSSVVAFNHSIDEAVMLENKQLAGQKRLLKFQELVKTIQAQPLDPNDPAVLVKAIVGKLDDNKERMADPARAQQLELLTQRLNQLANGAVPTVPAAAALSQPAADNPMNQVAASSNVPAANESVALVVAPVSAPAPPTNSLLWLALGLAGLGLLGIALLWNKLGNTREEIATLRRTLEVSSPKATGGNGTSPAGMTAAIKQEITRQIEQRVAEKQAKVAVAPLPLPPVVAALAPAAPTPCLRAQYANEAPFNNSFPARALSDQPGTYSMFLIESSEQQPEQGTFAVTGNLASHVRDHRSVLEPVCEYVSGYPLGSEARVITVEPGMVRRRGDDWEVVQRAKVRFE
ncbi:hypothetical protein [Hymenobacter siberiensis]|uniref:hypothetical protein n=1 Tax=Hymenobacter siberiensis TaxID=2848396 RepID=UPI001C1E0ED4|nr:hypothetical protein [Hymenobacter siberiensis]